jgi:hypothetical protein
MTIAVIHIKDVLDTHFTDIKIQVTVTIHVSERNSLSVTRVSDAGRVAYISKNNRRQRHRKDEENE